MGLNFSKRKVILVLLLSAAIILWFLLTVGLGKSYCISSSTYALFNTTFNDSSNNTVNLSSTILDMEILCNKLNNITAYLAGNSSRLDSTYLNLNGNATMLYAMNSTNLSLVNQKVDTTSFNLDSTNQKLNSAINNVSNLQTSVTDINSKITGLLTNDSIIVNSTVTHSLLLSNLTSYAKSSELSDAVTNLTSNITSVNENIPKMTNTTYLWIGLLIVLLVSVGLWFFNMNKS